VRQVATAMLTACGFAVRAAISGNQAVTLFRQHQNDICCIVCDLTMPDMDGWHTIAALRQLKPKIPVILTSGYDEACVMTGTHSAWPQAFLNKPYSIKHLRAALSQAMGDRTRADTLPI